MRWILIVMDSKTEVCPTVDIIWGNNHYIALFNVILTIIGQYPFHTSTRQKHLRQTKKTAQRAVLLLLVLVNRVVILKHEFF